MCFTALAVRIEGELAMTAIADNDLLTLPGLAAQDDIEVESSQTERLAGKFKHEDIRMDEAMCDDEVGRNQVGLRKRWSCARLVTRCGHHAAIRLAMTLSEAIIFT